ncbi:HNH endonuclease signature motif containing protein [Paraburkholderia sp. RL18-103-BIB-C]|uniref:HNH endonuclease signature motif containing protein n=1 Tax=Paraburkholderia sp. RL18-103-BIB-C TaxID=3031637 RepID=UPI0038BAF2EE
MPGQWSHLYNSPRWRRLRAAHLHEHPCCVMCLAQGYDTTATVVDHRCPHHGNLRLFFDPSNLQSLCKPHHDSSKQWEERRGIEPGCDANGNPLDARHPWNQRARSTS